MKHDPDNNDEGENIAYFGPPQPQCEGEKKGNCFQCREVVDDWYKEIKDYDFAQGRSKNGKPVLHFTQIVWSQTTKMGMATAIGNNKLFSVARYSEKGNMLPADNFVKNVPPLGSGPAPTAQPTAKGSPGASSAISGPTSIPPTTGNEAQGGEGISILNDSPVYSLSRHFVKKPSLCMNVRSLVIS
jgi:hypothetical protein